MKANLRNRMFTLILTTSIGFGVSQLNAQNYYQPWGQNASHGYSSGHAVHPSHEVYQPYRNQSSNYPQQQIYPSVVANRYVVPAGQVSGSTVSTNQQYQTQRANDIHVTTGVSRNGNPGHIAYNAQVSGNGYTQSHTLQAGVMRNPQTLGEVFERNDPHSSTRYLAGVQYQNETTTPSGMRFQNTMGAGAVADYDHSVGVSYDPDKKETFYGAKGSARMGAQVEGAAKQDWGNVGNVPISTETKGSVFVGAEAEAKAGITTGKGKMETGLGAEAFVGVKATASQNVTAGPVGATGSAEAWAGLGADVGANFKYKNGTINFETDGKAAIGVGGGFSVDGEVNVGEVYESGKAKYQVVDGWVDQQGQNFSNNADQAWNQTQNNASQAWNQSRNQADQAWNRTQNTARDVSGNVKNTSRHVSNNVKSTTRKVTSNVGNSAKKAGKKIKGLFGK